MARWTDADPLKMHNLYREQLSHPGVYEIGFCRKNGAGQDIFNPMYLGMSTVSMYDRLHAHYNGRGNEHIREYYFHAKRVRMDYVRKRDNLYFHFQRLGSAGAAVREARLLLRLGWGKNGYYPWNRKDEDLEGALKRLEEEEAALDAAPQGM